MMKTKKSFLMALSLYAAHDSAYASDLPTSSGISRGAVQGAKAQSAQDIINETSWWHRQKSEFFAGLIQSGMDADLELAQAAPPAPQNEDPESMAMKEFGWGLNGLYCADNPPAAEKSCFDYLSKRVVAKLIGCFPLDTDVQIPNDADRTLDVCLPQGHRDRLAKLGFPGGKPRMPKEIADNLSDVVGGSALSGSFANIIRRYDQSVDGPLPDGMTAGLGTLYMIDLMQYSQYAVDPGLDRIGGRAILSFNSSRGYMETAAIQTSKTGSWILRQQMGPGAWDNAQRRMMAAMFTNTTFNEHLGVAHLAVSATISSLVYMLPKDHPMRRMLHIHTIGAIPVNRYNVPLLLDGENAFFGQISSFNLKEIGKIMNDHLTLFNFNHINPHIDLARRNMTGDVGALHYGYAQSALRTWDMTEGYVRQYIGHYYSSEAALSGDTSLRRWYADVRRYLPNGSNTIPATMTMDSLVGLVTGFIYSDSFSHYKAGIDIINWGAWPNHVPARVYSDGSLPRVGQVSHTLNLLCATQPTERLTMSAGYFSQFALDNEGKGIMDAYAGALRAYQAELDSQQTGLSIIPAGKLKTSIYS